MGSIPGLGRSPGEGNGNPLQYSCLVNPMDRGALRATIRGVARVRHDWVTFTTIRFMLCKCFLSLCRLTFHFVDCFFLLCSFLVWCSPTYLEKAMAPHSSTLAWKIPWTEEPSRLQSMGLLRVRHDWPTSISLFTFIHWRRKWQPTPVFLPGEPQGQGSLVGCCLWSRTESDTTKAT